MNGFFAKGRAWTYRDIAVGFAVNAGKGLRVPIVRNTAQLSQLDVCRAVRELTLRYFREELSMQDVSGGTFTVTDLSGAGVTYFVPVLNDRQSAILGLCAADAAGQQNLVLAFDHRMSDGMRAAAFLGELRERIES
jgi:2-oxoglutarate dehydrogenase E2 component (dihydrolipoamide succinyltransferase)